MSEGSTPDNGRVTLAVLGQKLDEVLRRLDKLEDCFDKQNDRIGTLEQGAATRIAQLRAIEYDVQRLQSKDTAGTIAGVFTGIIAGLIAIFKQP